MNQRFNCPDRIGVLHYVTINIRQHRRIFDHDELARHALTLLRKACDNYPAKLVAYVVMPTHLHFIANPHDGKASAFVQKYKPSVTLMVHTVAREMDWKDILRWLLIPDRREHLWQEGKHDFHLWSEKLIWQKIDYIHNNPIRWGLVDYVDQYPYSSYHAWYESNMEPIVPIDKDFWWEDLPMLSDFHIGC